VRSPAGTPDQASGGETLRPRQEYTVGDRLAFGERRLFTAMAAGAVESTSPPFPPHRRQRQRESGDRKPAHAAH
jgi:hypothetical protein